MTSKISGASSRFPVASRRRLGTTSVQSSRSDQASAGGHGVAHLAMPVSTASSTYLSIGRGMTGTVSHGLRDAISALTSSCGIRDQRPLERTLAERRPAAAARTWAAHHGWPARWDSMMTASMTYLPAAYPLPPSHRRPERLKPAI